MIFIIIIYLLIFTCDIYIYFRYLHSYHATSVYYFVVSVVDILKES